MGHSSCCCFSLLLLSWTMERSEVVEVAVVMVERRRVVVVVPLAIRMRDVDEEKAEVHVAHERIMEMAGGTILICNLGN